MKRSPAGPYGPGRCVRAGWRPWVPAGVKSRRIYDEAVREAVILVWEASDRICGKRLKAALPHLVESMERHGQLDPDPQMRRRLLSASAATLDRRLKPVRAIVLSRRKRRRNLNPGRHSPVRTFAAWDRPPPGFLEIDLGAHCGNNMGGSFIYSLVATDVCAGWTDAVPLLAREQSLVVAGLETIAKQLPFPVLGIDSDIDSRQRQRVHQRHPHPVLLRPGHRVLSCPSVSQKLSSLD